MKKKTCANCNHEIEFIVHSKTCPVCNSNFNKREKKITLWKQIQNAFIELLHNNFIFKLIIKTIKFFRRVK